MSLNDFVKWQVRKPTPSDDPLRWWDALWSLFSNNGDFYRLFGRTMRPLVEQGVPANDAMVAALEQIFAQIIPLRDRLIIGCLDALKSQGVHVSTIDPMFVAQDWGQSQLTSSGVLSLRVEMWLRQRAAIRVEAEGEARIVFPRLGAPLVIAAQNPKASVG